MALLLRHPVAGDRGPAARGGRALVAAHLRPAARAARRPVADRRRLDRPAERSRLRRPAPRRPSPASSRSARTPSRCSIRGGKQDGGRRARGLRRGPRPSRGRRRPRSIKRHRARRRRHVARPGDARAAAPDRARHRRSREAAQGAAGADPEARARRRARDRGPPLLRPPGRRSRSDRRPRSSPTCAARRPTWSAAAR